MVRDQLDLVSCAYLTLKNLLNSSVHTCAEIIQHPKKKDISSIKKYVLLHGLRLIATPNLLQHLPAALVSDDLDITLTL